MVTIYHTIWYGSPRKMVFQGLILPKGRAKKAGNVVKRMPGLEHIAGAFYALRSAFFFASNWSWLTIDIRDNFAISIWEAAGISNIPVIFVGYYIYIYIYIYISDSWFGTWIYDFPYIGNVIIPTDELIFFTGVGQPPTRLTLIMTDYFLWQAECVNYVDYHCIVSKCSLWL